MSERSHGGPETPSNRENDGVREDPTVPSTSGGDSAGVSLVDGDKPVETRSSDNTSESEVLKLENLDSVVGEGERLPSSSISRGKINDSAKSEVENVRSEHEKVKISVDYDTVLSEFDQFAAKGTGEHVGYGYEIGDMVWGKVKSHPWWPGHIYNEAFASPSVQRSKREGHVLVAFFGDSSYGWFEASELVPFEENFVEKSRQTSSRAFTNATQEALDELSRRRSLGLACCCRNKFNFWPSTVKGYYVVDVGDYEPVVYSTSQINKSRESFHPNEMLSFIQQLAVTPMTNQHMTLEFIKNKATVLACRKALYEEFDDTYAQAFGSVPVHPPKPTAPVAVDPLKAPLSGRLVFAETIGKQKLSAVKPTKSKDQLEKDKYLFKRRDEPIQKKTKKTGATQYGGPLLVDGSALSGTSLDSVVKGHMQPSSINQASMINYIRPSEGSLRPVEVGTKKAKLQKQQGGESSAENATQVVKKRKKEITMGDNVGMVQKVKKRKKEITGDNVVVVEKTKKRKKEISEASAGVMKLPLPSGNSEASVEKVSGVPLDGGIGTANIELDNRKNDNLVTSSSSEAKQAVDFQGELPVLLKDLHALAVDQFHGVEPSRRATTRSVFYKFRSLVFQKSLVSSPQNEIETGEALHVPPEKPNKSTVKPLRALARPDDPTKGGKKRGPSDRPESVKKKKKLEDSDNINKRVQLGNLEDVKKKKKIPDDSKPTSVEKKIPSRSTESPSLRKVATLESNKKMQQPRKARNPTMLVMKFPPGSSLPSGAHLRAKFARFGPLDHAATRVFWKTHTCRLVFLHKVDAEEALKFARESNDLFGGTSVKSYIREVAPEAVETEPIKIQRDDTSAAGAPQSKDPTPKFAMPPHQQSGQLKSCLKKAPGEEVGGNGNNGRGTSRVKFILGGEESAKTEQVSSYSMDVTSKNLPKFNPQSNVAPLPPTHQMQKLPNNRPRPIQETTPSVPENDISQQLMNLLTRCNEVVNNLSGVLGYVPYHTL